MKILWFSNSPWSNTGYGNQTKVFLSRLQNAGHDMSMTAFYGLAGSPRKSGGIWIMPEGRDPYGNDVIAADAEYVKADIVISLIDVWVMQSKITSQFKWCPWMPVDHDPIPEIVIKALETAYQPIAYSRWGQQKLKEAGYDALYVPHGVETNVFKPMDKAEARAAFVGCPPDVFLAGIVSANKGNPSRKAFDQQIRAFAEFNRKYPDSMLYLHTDFEGVDHGEPLTDIIKRAGIPDKCIARPDPYKYARGMFGDDYMVAAYNAFDVLMNASRGEGFGIPILEAQACGTPVIVTDFSSMPELCFGGWVVPYVDKFFSYQNSYQVTPSVDGIIEALEKAYTLNKAQREAISRKARKGAITLDADKVVADYWQPVLKQIAGRLEDDKATVSRPHRWAKTGLYINGMLWYPCLDKDCTAGHSGQQVRAGLFPSKVGDIALDIEDDAEAGVYKVVMHEATNAYKLDSLDLKAGDTVIDIGAHVGVPSIYLAKKYPGVRVIAFEPSPDNYAHLQRNIKANGVKVEAINAAVTADGKHVGIPVNANGNTGGRSIYRHTAGDTAIVDSYSLEDLYTMFGVTRPTLLKIDCEGAEYEILEGNEELLKGIKYIIGEFHVNNRFSVERMKALVQMCHDAVGPENCFIQGGGMADSDMEAVNA